MLEKLGEKLREARLHAGLSQQALADRTGVDRADISRLENGQGNPTVAQLARLADGMGLRLELHLAEQEDACRAEAEEQPYLEMNLPSYLVEELTRLRQAKQRRELEQFDLLRDEVEGSIRAAACSNAINRAQELYLRQKYVLGPKVSLPLPPEFRDPEGNTAYPQASGNGDLLWIEREGQRWMLRFSEQPGWKDAVTTCLGRRLYRMLGIPARESILGECRMGDSWLRTAACCEPDHSGKLRTMEALMHSAYPGRVRGGFGIELEDILQVIDVQQLLPPEMLRSFFWDLFVADALLGNYGRSTRTWGISVTDSGAAIAPIQSCGSCLFPHLNDAEMEKVLLSPRSRSLRFREYPYSAILCGDHKISYREFLSSGSDPNCTAALVSLCERLDDTELERVIYGTPLLTDLETEFYFTILSGRRRELLETAAAKLHIKKATGL